jgi:enolase
MIRNIAYRAHGRLKPRGEMNKTEAAYAAHLKLRENAGEVLWWAFEAIKLRLANNTFITIDFAVMLADGSFESHEVKGRKGKTYYSTEDGKIKAKVAAEIFPWTFKIVWPLQGRGWGEQLL